MSTLTETRAREEICRVGASLFARGYVHATAGNISVRLDASQGGGFLITPTDACLGRLDPARRCRRRGATLDVHPLDLDAVAQLVHRAVAGGQVEAQQALVGPRGAEDHRAGLVVALDEPA